VTELLVVIVKTVDVKRYKLNKHVQFSKAKSEIDLQTSNLSVAKEVQLTKAPRPTEVQAFKVTLCKLLAYAKAPGTTSVTVSLTKVDIENNSTLRSIIFASVIITASGQTEIVLTNTPAKATPFTVTVATSTLLTVKAININSFT
jgi:hypothetical protein